MIVALRGLGFLSLLFLGSNAHAEIQTFKVLSRLEACFDLISSSSLSMKIQIMGGKITGNLGFKTYNMFYLISNELNKILKSGYNKRYPLLCEEFENEKKKIIFF